MGRSGLFSFFFFFLLDWSQFVIAKSSILCFEEAGTGYVSHQSSIQDYFRAYLLSIYGLFAIYFHTFDSLL